VSSRLDPLEVLNSTQTNVSIHTALTDPMTGHTLAREHVIFIYDY